MLFHVSKYLPVGLYGFLEAGPQRAFFHLSEFDPKGGPPPIIGEPVEVVRLEPNGDKSPRAKGVVRLHEPVLLVGSVTRFDHTVGYGFVSSKGEQYYLHRSEFPDGSLPLKGDSLEFFVAASPPVEGEPTKRPRACYVKILERGGG
jgi:cold shock CspA family protein